MIRVTDAKTGDPLPKAVLDPGRAAPWLKPVAADEQGLIHVPPGLLRSLQRHIGMMDIGLISEPGHLPKSWNGLLRFSDEWAAWNSSGEYRVALDPVGEKEVPLEIRLIGADGRPVAGALLLFRAVWWAMQFSSLPARTDDQGRARSLTHPAFVVDVFVRGSFVASWLLARDKVREATPEGAIRELRLPALAPVRVEIIDAGPSPLEALHRMPNAEAIDAGAIAAAKGKGFSPGDDFYEPGEPVPLVAVPDHPTIFEFLAPVGRDVEISFRRSDAKDWIRTLTVRAASAEPLKITRAWDDLANPVGR